MSFLLGVKDFASEMLTPNTTLKFKRMRFLSRFPSYRSKRGRQHVSGYKDSCANIDEIVVLDKPISEIVKDLMIDGFSRSISLSNNTVEAVIGYCNEVDCTPDRQGGDESACKI